MLQVARFAAQRRSAKHIERSTPPSAAQSSAFFAEVIEHGEVFAVRVEGGSPAPKNGPG
ncbi:hypothetical protein [Microbacterium sp. JB110]|uniref:hypothetical protein n=1 Tax=Microbacterium sp. JB110 TaxID=2024477 RepID=UPI001481E492|nr:hypothetical protein [Microbacterium sp. JB110]